MVEPFSQDTDSLRKKTAKSSQPSTVRMCFAYYVSFGLDVTILRSCNVYGQRQRSGKGGAVIPIFASQARSGEPLTIFGTGNQRREYIHVQDLVTAYDLVLHRPELRGGVLNVGTGETPSIQEIASFIADRMGVPIINLPARPGEVPSFSLDVSKIKELGFEPKVMFWDGLSTYLEEH